MNKNETIIQILKSQGIDAGIEDERYVIWTDAEGRENSIREDEADICGDKVAWFQSDENDSLELFRIFENKRFFDIKPVTDHPGYGCDIWLVEWYKEHLLLIYHEKHNVVISAVRDKNIKTIQFHGDQLIRRGNKLYYRNYGPNENVKILQIPELIELGEITLQEAEQNNVVPETLGYMNSLKNQ